MSAFQIVGESSFSNNLESWRQLKFNAINLQIID